MNEQYHYEEAKANKVKRFIETVCHQTKGRWHKQPIHLMPWQWDMLRTGFGWVNADGLRKTRHISCWVPRRSGKTFLAASVALFMLMADGEAGAEVYLVSNSIKQSRNLFDEAILGFYDQSPELKRRLKVKKSQKTIYYPDTHSTLMVLSSDVRSLPGSGSHCLIFDELAFYQDRRIFTNLLSSTGSREQPLIMSISTAGDDLSGIGKEEFDRACRIRDGVIIDPEFLPVIYEAPLELAWDSEEAMKAANPSLGNTIKIDFLRQMCEGAKSDPRKRAEYEMFHLNRWQHDRCPWLDMGTWSANGEPFDLTLLDGKSCACGLDIGRKWDSSCYSLVFLVDNLYYILPRFFLARQGIREREKREGMPFSDWASKGVITLCEGDTVDDNTIFNSLMEDSKKYQISSVRFDPYYCQQLSKSLQDQNILCEQIPQRHTHIGPATSWLEKLLKDKQVRHGNHPCLTWQASCTSVRADANGNIIPCKRETEQRQAHIDGISSLVNALTYYHQQQEQQPKVELFVF